MTPTKPQITPEWIAERRANIEEVEKRFWHRNMYIINGLKIYDGAKLSFLVEEDLPSLIKNFRVALDRAEKIQKRNDWQKVLLEEAEKELSEAQEEIAELSKPNPFCTCCVSTR